MKKARDIFWEGVEVTVRGERDHPFFGRIERVQVAMLNDSPMTWSEVHAAFVARFPDRWALEVFFRRRSFLLMNATGITCGCCPRVVTRNRCGSTAA